MKKTTSITLVIVALVVIGTLLFSGSASAYEKISTYDGDMTLYKSMNCGCCGVYSDYFQRKGNSDIEIVSKPTIDDIKEKYNIPAEMESCHTTVIGDYFIEGHIPLEAIEKLLEEEPDIAGIAMPGMPLGSPGMPGQKKGDFVIYAIGHDGSVEEFMRI